MTLDIWPTSSPIISLADIAETTNLAIDNSLADLQVSKTNLEKLDKKLAGFIIATAPVKHGTRFEFKNKKEVEGVGEISE
jgi:hypothetical protein